MIESYIKLGISALLPVFVAVIYFLLDKKTGFGKINGKVKQVIFGISFGALAVLGTEWGIPLNGAVVNTRDACVLTAGLMFGAPAGVIAGLIGGVERWIAVAWGVGTFTRVACTVSTILAGLYAALLRKMMFEDRKPGWLLSLAIGVVMEVFHLTMVFLTNMNTPTEAMNVVRVCTVPMVVANGLSVMLSAVALTVVSGERFFSGRTNVRISQKIQRWLFLTVAVAFFATSIFVFSLQDRIAVTQADTLLELALSEVSADIRDSSNESMLNVIRKVEREREEDSLDVIAERYELAEISIIDSGGVIVKSTNPEYVGYDMSSGTQSAEFLCLLGDTVTYVQDYGPISSDPSILRKYAGLKTSDGFLQIGYGALELQRDVDKSVITSTKNRHVGKTGYLIVVDERFQAVSIPEELNESDLLQSMNDGKSVSENTTFKTVIGDSGYFCRYRKTEGYYIVSCLPEAEAMQMRNIAFYVNSFMEILVFAILFALIYLLIKRVVVNQIKNVNCSLSRITGGDLEEVVNVRSSEEFASLSDDINSTVDTLKQYISEASARIDQELEFAKNIQTSALPSSFPAFPKRHDFDIYACMNPAKEVGGDFYDFYLTDRDQLHFLIADVSGKGIPAAMFMMRAKTELKTLTEAELPICDVFTVGNRALCEGNDAGMFVTAWQGGIDLDTGLVRYVNAGHNPPLVRRAGGKFEYLKTKVNFVLAGMDGVTYRKQELQLSPGDIIYLYTDGVTEATDAENRLYGEERLLETVNSADFSTVRELCEAVKADMARFVGDAPQFDDVTMLALEFIGQPPVPQMHFDEASIDDIPVLTEFIEQELEKLDCPMKIVTQFSIAIDEIYSNIVRYGYPDRTGPVDVQLIVRDDPEAFCLKFTDEGIPYNPLTKEDPDVSLSAEERKIGGLGIFMVKKTMDEMKYKYENNKNILTIKKQIKR